MSNGKRGAAHEKEKIVRGPTGFQSDRLLEGAPLERLHRMLAREYEHARNPDYVSISWAMQEKAQAFCLSVDFEIVPLMVEIQRLNPRAFDAD